jgi:P27 family predicted phage terminase small subunit
MRGLPSGKKNIPKGEAQPQVLNGAEPPIEMTPSGKAIWHELTPKLEALGLFTELDTFAFRRYCELMARWSAASKKIQETGQTHVPIFHEQTDEQRARGDRPKLKYLQELPESIEFRRLPGELLRLEAQFGLTPAARAAISIIPKSKNAPTDIQSFLYGSGDYGEA